MRVVAFHTIPFHHSFMNAFGILRHNPLMALHADFVRVYIEQLSVRRSMRIVTGCAFTRFHGSMHELVFELFLKRVMAAQTQLSFCIGFEFELALGVSNSSN